MKEFIFKKNGIIFIDCLAILISNMTKVALCFTFIEMFMGSRLRNIITEAVPLDRGVRKSGSFNVDIVLKYYHALS